MQVHGVSIEPTGETRVDLNELKELMAASGIYAGMVRLQSDEI